VSAQLSTQDRDYLRRSCDASNVPVKVTDPVVVARAARLLRGAS